MQLLIDILSCVLLALIPACFNYFLDYALGHPMSDRISTKAIFFKYSYWLAKRRLPEKKEREIVKSLEVLLNNEDPDTRRQGTEQLKLSIMTAGREFFFIEQAFGMCPFCTNFWVAQITALILFFTIPLAILSPLTYFILLPIFSHTILRKL
jgi:hypothetical protein